MIIPTRDRASFVTRAIESVRSQTWTDLEVVVVDDGSTDETADVVARMGDSRIRLIRHERNKGPSAARNSGISAATGWSVAFLDDDDLWLPTKLERQLPLLGAAPVVHALVYVADAQGNVYDGPSERGFRIFREVAAAGYPYAWLLRRSSFQINTVVVRREAVEQVGGFDETLRATEDLDFVHRLRRRFEFRLVDEPLAKYCLHKRGTPGTTLAEGWLRLVAKELDYVRSTPVADRRKIEAFLEMRRAQSAYILGRRRKSLLPALRAYARDRSVISRGDLARFTLGGILPERALDAARARRGRAATVREPDPWIDLR